MPHAAVDDSQSSAKQKSLGERLRLLIALRNRTGLEADLFFVGVQVIEFAAEISGEIYIIKCLRLLELRIVHIFQKSPLVESDFLDRGFQFETGIPGAARRTVEPAAIRCGVGEGSIDDLRFRDAKDQFVGMNAGRFAIFGQFSLICGRIKFA